MNESTIDTTRFSLALLLLGASVAAAAPRSTLLFDTPKVSAGLDDKAVSAKLEQANSKLRACFDKEHAKDPSHDGRSVMLELTIKADGKVTDASAIDARTESDTHVATPFEKCITGVITGVRFTSAKKREPIRVTVGMAFTADDRVASFTGAADVPDRDAIKALGMLGSAAFSDDVGVGCSVCARPPSTKIPSLVIGTITRTGDLDVAIIRRYIKRNVQRLQYCYENQLLVKPGIGGVLVAKFRITPAGIVERAEASGVDPDVAACVTGVLAAIEYPKPKGGTEVVVEKLPLTYAPGTSRK